MSTSADRMAAAYFGALEALCEVTPKGWYAQRGSACAVVSHARTPMLNSACAITLDPDVYELAEVAVEVARHGVPWSIVVRGEASEAVADLAALHGLTSSGTRPFMVCPAEDAVLRGGRALETVRVVGAAESDRYTEALTEGFEAPEGIFGTVMGGGVLDARTITGYLAEGSGHPVGTGLGIRSLGTVGVFNVAVAPSARGQGLGRAITERVMADGFAAGADAAFLHASTMGRPLYESMGFRLVENWTAFKAA
jgi:ribosomal protein S18 acetylase RimI-like enzyme